MAGILANVEGLGGGGGGVYQEVVLGGRIQLYKFNAKTKLAYLPNAEGDLQESPYTHHQETGTQQFSK